MSLTNLSIQNVSKFHNLALFLCHLFIDGHFRHVHTLYDPKIFNGQFMAEINSICPVEIPWRLADITKPSFQNVYTNDRSDHV